MNDQFLVINALYIQSIRNDFLDMTINNPIFIFALITVIWFIPGLIVRRIKEVKKETKKKKTQSEAIERLYPKSSEKN